MSAKKLNLGFETQFHLAEKTFVFNYRHAELLNFFPYQKLQAYLMTIYNFFSNYFVGLAYQGKDIVFRFIIECNSCLRDFGP
jgi:hypothetical protein